MAGKAHRLSERGQQATGLGMVICISHLDLTESSRPREGRPFTVPISQKRRLRSVDVKAFIEDHRSSGSKAETSDSVSWSLTLSSLPLQRACRR